MRTVVSNGTPGVDQDFDLLSSGGSIIAAYDCGTSFGHQHLCGLL